MTQPTPTLPASFPSYPGVRVLPRWRARSGWAWRSQATDPHGPVRRPTAVTGQADPLAAFEAAVVLQQAINARLHPERSGMTVRDFVERVYLVRPEGPGDNTARSVDSCLRKWIYPRFGDLPIQGGVTATMIDQWMRDMSAASLKPATRATYLGRLKAILNYAVRHDYASANPADLTAKPRATRRRRCLQPGRPWEDLRSQFHGDGARLLVELAIETGLRYGEITNLRPQHLVEHPGQRPYLRVTETVVWLGRNRRNGVVGKHPYERQDFTKSGLEQVATGDRRLHLTEAMVERLTVRRDLLGLAPDDLFFPLGLLRAEQHALTGFTRHRAPCAGEYRTATGILLPHGDYRTYNAGCRGRSCVDASTQRRAGDRAIKTGRVASLRPGDPGPRQGSRASRDDWIPNQWWNAEVWGPAVARSRLGWQMNFHELRHAHGSWLSAIGWDAHRIMTRLGHSSLKTTEKYLHQLHDVDPREIAALRVRWAALDPYHHASTPTGDILAEVSREDLLRELGRRLTEGGEPRR